MEAITVAGLIVLGVGGYYSIIDLLHDLGIHWKKAGKKAQRSFVSRCCILTPQTGIKKMAGMNICQSL